MRVPATLGSKYVGPVHTEARSSEKPNDRYFRQPKRLFSDSDVCSSESVFCWNSKLVLKRRLQTSRVTTRRSTVPGAGETIGRITITVDRSGAGNGTPPTVIPDDDCRFRRLSSIRAAS